MAVCAALFPKYPLAARGLRIEMVGIGRGLERFEEECQRVQLRVTITPLGGRIGQFGENGEIEKTLEAHAALHERRIAHQIAYGTLADQACVVQVSPLADTNQVGDLRREIETRIDANRHSRRDGFVQGCQLVQRHLFQARERVRAEPWNAQGEPAFMLCLLEKGLRLGRLRVARAQSMCGHAIIGHVSLRALNHASIRHHSQMASRTRPNSQLDFPFLPNHVASERHYAFFCHWHLKFPVPVHVPHVGKSHEHFGIIINRSLKYGFPRPNPILS